MDELRVSWLTRDTKSEVLGFLKELCAETLTEPGRTTLMWIVQHLVSISLISLRGPQIQIGSPIHLYPSLHVGYLIYCNTSQVTIFVR